MELLLAAIDGLPKAVIDPAGDTILILSNRRYRRLYQCSSAKLVQNCDHFKKKLAPGEQPHTELIRDGIVYMTINEFEPDAIEIILNLVHGRIRNIPRSPRRTLLLDLARFCNYLQCFPTVKPFAECWIEKTKDTILTRSTLESDTNSWIFISLIFRHQEVFRYATALTQQCMDDRMDIMRVHGQAGLVPKDMIRLMNKSREKYIDKLARYLYEHFKQLSRGPAICSTKCDNLYVGLMMDISQSDLIPFFHRAEGRLKGLVAKNICLELQYIINTNYLNNDRRCASGREAYCPNIQHPLGRSVESHLQQITTLLGGLDLPEQD